MGKMVPWDPRRPAGEHLIFYIVGTERDAQSGKVKKTFPLFSNMTVRKKKKSANHMSKYLCAILSFVTSRSDCITLWATVFLQASVVRLNKYIFVPQLISGYTNPSSKLFLGIMSFFSVVDRVRFESLTA